MSHGSLSDKNKWYGMIFCNTHGHTSLQTILIAIVYTIFTHPAVYICEDHIVRGVWATSFNISFFPVIKIQTLLKCLYFSVSIEVQFVTKSYRCGSYRCHFSTEFPLFQKLNEAAFHFHVSIWLLFLNPPTNERVTNIFVVK